MRLVLPAVIGVLLVGSLRVSECNGETAMPDSAWQHRFTALEEKVDALSKDNARLRADLGIEGRAGQAVVKPAGREPVLSFGGLVQSQAEFGDKGDSRYTNGNDRFFLRRARLNASGRYLEEFDFKVEL